MKFETKDQWRRAIIERRVEKVRAGTPELDQILDRLIRLEHAEDWMATGLIDAAAQEWESRIRDFDDEIL